MSLITQAQQYGVINVDGNGDAIVSGRGLLWTVCIYTTVTDILWDSLTDDTGEQMVFFKVPASQGISQRFHWFNDGQPFYFGLSSTLQMSITYTPLP